MNFFKILLNLDIFGSELNFNIHGKNKYKTYIGAFFTCASILSFIIIIMVLTKDILLRKHLQIITTINNQYSKTETISTDTFVFAFGLQDINYTNYIDESIYILNASILDTFRNEDGSSEIKITNLKVTKCSLLNIKIIPEYFKGVGMHNLYCLNEPNFTLKGEFGEANWRYLIFKFSKCQNSTENNFSCKSEEEIKKRLNRGYFGAFVTDIIVKNTDYKFPLSKFGKNLFTFFSCDYYQDLWVYLKKIQIVTDYGYFFEDKKIEEDIALDKYESTIDYREDINFYTVKIRMSTKVEVYERDYRKITEVIGNIGGLIKIILIFSRFCVSYFNSLLLKKYLIQFFHFDDDLGENYLYRDIFTKNFSNISQNNNVSTNNNSNTNINNKSNRNENSNIRTMNSNNPDLNFGNIKLISGSFNVYYKKYLNEKKRTTNKNKNLFFRNKMNKIKRIDDRFCFKIYCKKNRFQRIRKIHKKFKYISFLTDIIYYYKSLFKIQLLEYNLFDINKRKNIVETDCYDYYFFNDEKISYDIKYKNKTQEINFNYSQNNNEEIPNLK